MVRVYAIHTGEYSDQSWGPVFSSAEKALAYKTKYGPSSDDIDIDVYVLDDENDTGPVYPQWIVVFDADANIIHHATEGEPELFEPLLVRTEVVIPPKQNRWWFLDGPGVRDKAALVVRTIHAPDLEHAIKIAADARTVFLVRERETGRPHRR